MPRAIVLLLAMASCSSIQAGELDGHYRATLDGQPSELILRQSGALVEGEYVESQRLRLIDFDDAGFGWHMFELATALYFCLDDPRYEQIKAALLEGYHAVKPLSEADRRTLALFLMLRGTTYLGWIHTRDVEKESGDKGGRSVVSALKQYECSNNTTPYKLTWPPMSNRHHH